MKKFYFIALAIIIATAETSCSKYEDGPLISLKSKKTRLLGVWKVVEFMKDNEDLTKFYQDTCGCEIEFYVEQITSTSKKNWYKLHCEQNDWNFGFENIDIVELRSFWEFSKDKTKIWLTLGQNLDNSYRKGMYPLTICRLCWASLEILRLTVNDFWVKYEDFDNIYTIKFEKI
jgi:hypothetical protein